MLYKSRQAVILNYLIISSLVSEVKYKTIHWKEIPSILAHAAKVSDPKFFNNLSLKILSPKQMLQRLPIALAQVKAGNTSENLLNEMRQIICSL